MSAVISRLIPPEAGVFAYRKYGASRLQVLKIMYIENHDNLLIKKIKVQTIDLKH
jgi:hypothetical protein